MTTAATPPPVSLAVAKFLAAIRAAELFAPMQLARVEAAIPADASTPAEAAHALVAAGFLTQFQADRLLTGKTDGFLLGPYVILEQVGRGAMGRVYKARHRTMNRPVAVKVLSAELTRTAAARQAFQKEVRAAAQLNHPNIVTAYDANELAERFYIVLEFVDGPNLDTLVRARGALPVLEACELMRQAAEGLAHAHSHGMVHRGIKPGNLLLAGAPELKIADFGIAKLSPSQTPAPGGQWPGTADYVAPEQAHNPALTDTRSDLYSLGAVLYFLLTGQPPFPGGTAEEKVHRHMWEEPARLDLLRPDVPPMLVALVHQLLAKHPAHRPASAAEVAHRLNAFVTGEAVCFDLPPAQAVPHSFIAGPLSDTHTVAAATTDTTPWDQITAAMPALDADADEGAKTKRAPRRKKAGVTAWLAGGLAISMLVLCLAAISMLIKTMGK